MNGPKFTLHLFRNHWGVDDFMDRELAAGNWVEYNRSTGIGKEPNGSRHLLFPVRTEVDIDRLMGMEPDEVVIEGETWDLGEQAKNAVRVRAPSKEIDP